MQWDGEIDWEPSHQKGRVDVSGKWTLLKPNRQIVETLTYDHKTLTKGSLNYIKITTLGDDIYETPRTDKTFGVSHV